jgi:transcriptional regulator with XRE-family HTH domain
MTTWPEHKARTPLRGKSARAYEAARQEMGVGYLILKARAHAGLTQEGLARRIGTSQPTIARWESGAQVPSVRSLTKIADATGFELTVGLRQADHTRQFLSVRVL